MATSAVLVERYGAPRPWRRRFVVWGCALVVATFAAWLTWTIGAQVRPQVSSDLETWSRTGEHSVTAVVVVELASPDVVATCKLRATAEDHTVVGEYSFRPDPATRRQVQDFRTEREATSVESLGCTAPGQTRRR